MRTTLSHAFANLVRGASIAAMLVLPPIGSAEARARLTLDSVDGHATIALSCDASKKLELVAAGRVRGPIVRPADPAIAPKRAMVQYTFDGETPIVEQWLPRHEGSTPADAAQLRAFTRRLFLGHVLHLSLDGLARPSSSSSTDMPRA
ncbi:MAG: hypothetical protein IT562_11235 [Alphaproteobacteria bacterium]|nr:hypothetical protein [Alphaproteobacteria bacterium]